MKALFYDTETTGMPLFKAPSGDPAQPHLLQIAAALIDTDTRADLAAINLTIKVEDWEIDPEAQDVHGITAEFANAHGVPEWLALRAFLELWHHADTRVGHAETFDARIIRIAMKRYVSDAAADAWKLGSAICTYQTAKANVPELKPKGMGSLDMVHRHYLGEGFDGAHTAEADMRATARVFFAMLEKDHV